ncbi:DUF1837 domain-containing protein [bacterium]|nr:DUF1837 domain-containing protein [bacterium]
MVGPFEIIVDTTLIEAFVDLDKNFFRNKKVSSLANSFEDGAWRTDVFLDFVWDNIADTALSAEERSALEGRPGSILRQSAKNLRLTEGEDHGSGSELAEILLYGIMRHKHGALPAVPKIFYKQNKNDYAKGADSVHITVNDDDTYALWFGEAKFYNSIESSSLSKVVASVKESVRTEKLKKENVIIRNVRDLDYLGLPTDLVASIKEDLLSDKSMDDLRGKINVPILLLHTCGITADTQQWSEEYIESIRGFHLGRAKDYFEKQFASMGNMKGYEKMEFHLILVPVPSKDSLTEKFVQHARATRGE